jgi:Tfp pilus assembly protein PilF
MRLAEARITLGVVAARQGDLDQAIHQGERALTGERKSLPSLLMVSRDLTNVLHRQYPAETQTKEYLEQLAVLAAELAHRPL